jgi:DNA-directed RNA polymerase subunit M/transcription elongation factor TFIIS
MHFCTNCSNMYYIRLSEEDPNSIVYYCRNCGHENKNISLDSVTISKTNFKHNKQKYNSIINKYTKMDPTLPRVNTIKCPNQACASNEAEKEKEREIIYLRYDDVNMNFVYMCSTCDTVWNTEQSAS